MSSSVRMCASAFFRRANLFFPFAHARAIIYLHMRSCFFAQFSLPTVRKTNGQVFFFFLAVLAALPFAVPALNDQQVHRRFPVVLRCRLLPSCLFVSSAGWARMRAVFCLAALSSAALLPFVCRLLVFCTALFSNRRRGFGGYSVGFAFPPAFLRRKTPVRSMRAVTQKKKKKGSTLSLVCCCISTPILLSHDALLL